MIILEEDDDSDQILPTSRPQPTEPPSIDLPPMVKSSWEVKFDALLSSTSGVAGPSAATTKPAELTVLVRLQELLSLSASQVLERQGLDLVGSCLKGIATDGQLSTEVITQASSTLERT
ncbi:uncharacterized protein LOC126603991 [Malus sylvestris]|uniref:uncharacterized protein LOC126603991 n=1 Tax=Malus sylvestris TaxID=3752 RepID=UPI0021AD18FE|nr:uncharacterized protein LOC126603991 [Malus sylvestris]